MTTTLIVSDIHLGSRNSRADQLSLLLRCNFDRLILNGDIINSVNLKKLRPAHWKLLDQLRHIARQRELILVRGNHDGEPGDEGFGTFDVLATLLGVPLHEDYRLEQDSRQYLVLHGDRFDPTLNWPILTDTAEWCYQAVQKINRKGAKWLKHKVKKLGGVVQFVKRRSVDYARSRGCQGVVTGHTHFCDDEWIDDVHYLNTGCWVDQPCTYVVAAAGGIQLHHWDCDRVPRVVEKICTTGPVTRCEPITAEFAKLPVPHSPVLEERLAMGIGPLLSPPPHPGPLSPEYGPERS
jgi:UDP-2,3-diacylglucosamine pyrophosphatase LpxH